MTVKECRMLVVEDDYFLAVEIAGELQTRGVTIVGPVATIDDALAIIQRDENLDGAFVDLNLGGQMTYPVADALIARGVPLVFATGYDQSAIPPRYNAVPRHEKPLDPEKICRALIGLSPGPAISAN